MNEQNMGTGPQTEGKARVTANAADASGVPKVAPTPGGVTALRAPIETDAQARRFAREMREEAIEIWAATGLTPRQMQNALKIVHAQLAQANDRIAELAPAADCWNALSACYRITCMGSAGLMAPLPNGYAHATFNLWTIRPEVTPTDSKDAQDLHGRERLGQFMKIALKNNAPAGAKP